MRYFKVDWNDGDKVETLDEDDLEFKLKRQLDLEDLLSVARRWGYQIEEVEEP